MTGETWLDDLDYLRDCYQRHVGTLEKPGTIGRLHQMMDDMAVEMGKLRGKITEMEKGKNAPCEWCGL